MKKMNEICLALGLVSILLLSACAPQTNTVSPVPEQVTQNASPSEHSEAAPSADQNTGDEPVADHDTSVDDTLEADFSESDNSNPQPETEDPAPATTEETIPTTDELSADAILVDFHGELTTLSSPFRVYSPMFTTTEDTYYVVDQDAMFTVANTCTNENTYLVISIREHIRSDESFFSTVNHDGEYKDIDMLNEYWNNDIRFWLSSQTITEISAGEGLYWTENALLSEVADPTKLFSGDSVSFRMPDREQDTIYLLYVKYYDDTDPDNLDLPYQRFWVSADDVYAPSTAVTP